MELKPLRSADKKYMKITFYLSEELYSNYRDLQKRAKTLGYKLDLTSDFSVWFNKQIEEAEASIKKIEK
ncbi:MAG: hypothetical protein D8M58_10910 [Calditrichaeota bacterium]|nr:MAG: hypothetical protein DWQ03_10285 [Calditrichota bacterium]MBL1205902.1 hypothetical protein [Calditrichota bacterium]NOG45730.1 hypothetical protein [Calditrichota bacterium]